MRDVGEYLVALRATLVIFYIVAFRLSLALIIYHLLSITV